MESNGVEWGEIERQHRTRRILDPLFALKKVPTRGCWEMGGAYRRRCPLSLDRDMGRHCLLAARFRAACATHADARRRDATLARNAVAAVVIRLPLFSAFGRPLEFLRREGASSVTSKRHSSSSCHFVGTGCFLPTPLRTATVTVATSSHVFSLNGRSLVKKPATCTRLVSSTREWSHDTRTFQGKNTEDTPPRTVDLASNATKYVYSTECAINHRSVGN